MFPFVACCPTLAGNWFVSRSVTSRHTAVSAQTGDRKAKAFVRFRPGNCQSWRSQQSITIDQAGPVPYLCTDWLGNRDWTGLPAPKLAVDVRIIAGGPQVHGVASLFESSGTDRHASCILAPPTGSVTTTEGSWTNLSTRDSAVSTPIVDTFGRLQEDVQQVGGRHPGVQRGGTLK